VELFRLSLKPESGEEEKEIVLNTDAEMQAPAQDGTDAEESTPAPEPADIPIQDLLSDLVGVSRRLGITPPARAEPAADEASDVSAEPAADETRDADAERSEEGDAAEPDSSEGPQVTGPSPTGYRRYALHGLLLTLALVAAIGGFFGAERLTRTESTQGSPAQSQDDDSRLPIIVATVPSAAAGQAPTTAEPTPEATPEPAPDLQPAYFLYTAQPGDAVIAIAEAFAISPDYILWNNPDLIYDPNLVLIDQELLIPSVDGIIYRAKPGDTLSAIAALYQIDVESIVDFAPNGLTSPDNAIEGMVLILPGAVPPLLPWPPEVVEPTASEPQPTEPTPTPEAPTPSEPQAMEPTPTAEEPPPFSIGHIYP
jgi:LysM repeat protein